MGTGVDSEIDSKLKQWLDWDKNEESRNELLQLVENKQVEELQLRLFSRIEFGTAGLRARMAAGFSMMNDLTVIQASQGLCKYVLSTGDQKPVVIGFDGRHKSNRFALLTAGIFVNQGIRVYLFSKMCPTPYIPYTVLHLGCVCGVMITASHNPKDDNGYKVYWTNGAQITSPIDREISKCISENLEPWKTSWDTSVLETSPLCMDPYDKIFEAYNKDVVHLCYFREQNARSSVKFTYTAMHGVGYPYAVKSLQMFGFPPPIPVKEQIEPDPEFSTVKYPNPEEGKGALILAMKTADEHDSPVILANDPDADRLALAEKSPSGQWKIFTGNEIGALLGWWSWYTFHQKNPNIPASDVYMLASTVSSKILHTIAQKEGFHFEETLTGFKWMGNKADQLKQQHKTVIFAFEEAIGFMCGTAVLDKDGISAAAVCAELTAYVYAQGNTLAQKLDDIYTQYGFHLSSNSYFICYQQEIIQQMFNELRNYEETNKYPETCGPYKIKYVRDLTVGYDNSQPDNKPVLPVSRSSQMITFTFENGCTATIRTSGTEPKIKYYTEHRPDPKRGMDQAEVQNELDKIVECIKTYFFRPDKFGLIARTDN
ncbi:hypothetical protein ACJMK2_032746 [Sinanodonta woodiana]|uniref:Phosphoglucomutase-2 n=1 Tax=Sinanodonta woodiana TaxID=1069815 RepID=A0ABD3X397_SINWO